MDRNILTGLLVLGIIMLLGRRRQVVALLRANLPIFLFYSYCLTSIAWSGFPDVAFKRWTKFLADLVMVLIVLTDADRSSAIKRFLARTAFVLVPISVLLIKYYPDLGRVYGRFEGTLFFTGVATDKNMLGKICLLLGLATVWRLRQILSGAKGTSRTGHLVAHVVILGMVLWLLLNANSMTSSSVFALGSALIVATSIPALARRRWTVHVLVAAALAVAFSALFLDVGSGLVATLGRDPTLTGRTELWAQVLRMNQDPILGVGFESFWLGSRLERLWHIYWWHPNQAHNGYLEIFLNLGGVGVALLVIVIATGYRNIVRTFRSDPDTGRLRLAYFVAGVATNFTEANFKMLSPVWITFLLATIAVPGIPLAGRAMVESPTAECDMEKLEEVV